MDLAVQTHQDVVPVCVDLDGTLIRSDLLVETAFLLLRQSPFTLVMMLIWLCRGRAVLKREIAARVSLDVTTLPYDQAVLDWLAGMAGRRRRILCTASDMRLAQAVADHLGLFDEVIASDGRRNLAGAAKAAVLIDRFGHGGFDYLGDSAADLAVWPAARAAFGAGLGRAVRRKLAAGSDALQVESISDRPGSRLKIWLRALRVHQWTKNLLVLLPLLAAHQAAAPMHLAQAILAVIAFSVCASGVYLLNDLLDLEADRRHPHKRNRPFAKGDLKLAHGAAGAVVLPLAGLAIAAFLPAAFLGALAGYYALTMAYSLGLKRIAMLDVVILAALYTIRIIAGTLATGLSLSFWMLAFSMFVFLSLALLKRYTELAELDRAGRSAPAGRGYLTDDLSMIQSMGAASGYLGVLVLALYINSPTSRALYQHPQILWLLCPVLLYWISRIWLLARRGAVHHDPVVFALKDVGSRAILLAGALIVMAAAL